MRRLSKSNILSAVNCQRRLYLDMYKPELASKEDNLALDYLAKQGYEFEKAVASLFPDARSQQVFIHDNVYIRIDILDCKSLIEVKSSTKINDMKIMDTAIQYSIMKSCGTDIQACKIAIVNKDYVRGKELSLNKLVKIIDVTEDVNALLPEVNKLINKCRKTALLKRAPCRTIGPHCFDCPFVENCSSKLIDKSVFNLRRGKKKAWRLYENGISELHAIPDSADLTHFQSIQREAAISNRDHVEKGRIKDFIRQLQYPIYFLDFEAFTTAMPRYQKCSPYDQVSFQASIHCQNKAGGELSHFEFLHNRDTDPRKLLARFLVEHIQSKGSVVAYYASYERGRLKCSNAIG